MKKLLLSLFTIMLGLATTYATETDVVFSTMGYENAQDVTEVKVGDITVAFDANGNKNSPKYYTGGTAIRMYPNNIMTITTSSSEDISSLVLTFSEGKYAYIGAFKVDPILSSGTYAEDGVVGTWTGSSKTITITCPDATSGSIRLQSIKVNTGAAATVSTPTFSPDGGTFYAPQTVTIDCVTEGAKIYYTIDGTAPTAASTEYTTPIEVATTTTIKAIAVKGSDVSAVASETYIIETVTSVTSIAEFLALAEGTVANISIPVAVTYQNGSRLYVTDGTSYLQIYGNCGQTYTNGMLIPAGFQGTRSTYNGLEQMSLPVASTFLAGQDGAEVSPIAIGIGDVTEANQSMYVTLTNVTYTAGTGSNGTFSSNGTTVASYNQFGITISAEEGQAYDVVGIISVFKNVQFLPLSFSKATGLRDITDNSLSITTDYRAIHINTADSAEVSVFNLVGQPVVKTVVSGGSTMLQVAPGFYLVKVNNKTTKVLVK